MAEYWDQPSEEIFNDIIRLLEPDNTDELWEFLEELRNEIKEPTEETYEYNNKKLLYNWLQLIELVKAKINYEDILNVDSDYNDIDLTTLTQEQKKKIKDYYHKYTMVGNVILNPSNYNNNNNNNNFNNNPTNLQEGGRKYKKSKSKKTRKLRNKKNIFRRKLSRKKRH